MKLKPLKLAPGLIALGVIALVCLARWLDWGLFERLELMSYDMRARQALRFAPPVATNLGFVFIDEDSLRAVRDRSLGYSYGLLWPRHVYGRLVQELAGQGARAVAFDVLFGELRGDHAPVQMADGTWLESDDYFALQVRRASNVVLAVTREVVPPALFLTNALAIGDISTEKDSEDGILRRVQCFRYYTNWHTAFRQAQAQLGFDLSKARLEGRQVVVPHGDEEVKFALDGDGNFDLADFVGDRIPPGMARKNKPFTLQPVWHMGVVLGARELGLALAKAAVDLRHGRILLRGPNGLERRIAVDAQGYAYVDWCLPPEDGRLTKESIQSLLLQDKQRLEGQTRELTNRWRGKLVVVGSSALVGNNLTDRGATPLAKDTLLVSKHWNVANSIITGRFVQRSSLGLDLFLVIFLGLLAAELTWELRVLVASGAVGLLTLLYIVVATALYIQTRFWLPIILPVLGVGVSHGCLVTWRVVFEQAERRRVRAVLSTIVSPKIAHVLLESEKLALGGARREITVLFADVRGFTEFTDMSQERVAEFVREQSLSGAAAEACFDKQARETLETVNLYLGLVAETILQHDGAWDKFIGDCVMAFWGAPNPEPKHALACVRAAIHAQRAVDQLNQQRLAENRSRELENQARVAAGLPPRPLLPVLQMGTGVNTGMATVGMMGSQVKTVVRQANYTVFGREVNLASRLEGLSGSGRIFIGEATYQHLLRDDPALAATCIPQSPERVKGISVPVKVFEVPWKRVDAAAPATVPSQAGPAGEASPPVLAAPSAAE